MISSPEIEHDPNASVLPRRLMSPLTSIMYTDTPGNVVPPQAAPTMNLVCLALEAASVLCALTVDVNVRNSAINMRIGRCIRTLLVCGGSVTIISVNIHTTEEVDRDCRLVERREGRRFGVPPSLMPIARLQWLRLIEIRLSPTEDSPAASLPQFLKVGRPTVPPPVRAAHRATAGTLA